MAELVALVASVVGLVQAAEWARKSLGAVCDLRNAPAEVKRVAVELQHILDVAHYAEHFVKSSQPSVKKEVSALLHSHISTLKADLEAFRNLIEPRQFQDTGWGRLRTRLKWVTGLD